VEADWLKDAEEMVLKSRIKIPYTWYVGETGGRFFVDIRDNKRITGTRCEKCGINYVPPRKTCGRCFSDLDDSWREVGPGGVVESFTVVHYHEVSHPKDPPVIYGLIKLDGADTALVHLLAGVEPGEIRTGMRVKAVFAEKREGHMKDIEGFVPAEGS